jgi:hypothetical protein
MRGRVIQVQTGVWLMGAENESAVGLYTDGKYAQDHPTWHLEDAPTKAGNMMPGLRAVIKKLSGDTLRIADVGAGVGGVGINLKKMVQEEFPNLKVELSAFEIAGDAVKRGRELFPDLVFHQKFLEKSDGPFDAVVLADVLEHLENPWELLRICRAASSHLLVNQPLLENYGTFKHNAYQNQRDQWGHIAFFNYRSFNDMALATGWKPLCTSLLAPWEHFGRKGKASFIKRIFVSRARVTSSFFISGFYLSGAFEGES